MIPHWNPSGVLPPYVSDPKDRSDMSPYVATIEEVARRFVISEVRRQIFRGFLEYRRALVNVGVIRAFQWLDGSYTEHVERTEGRNPHDIDVVTFGYVPVKKSDVAGKRALVASNPTLFRPKVAKQTFGCDAYFVDLDVAPHFVVDDTRYWFGLFTHKRATNLWKGMVVVGLGGDDTAAWREVT